MTGAGIKLRRWQQGQTDKSIIIIYLRTIYMSAERWAFCHDKIYYYCRLPLSQKWTHNFRVLCLVHDTIYLMCILCSNVKTNLCNLFTRREWIKLCRKKQLRLLRGQYTFLNRIAKHLSDTKWKPFLNPIHIPYSVLRWMWCIWCVERK